jgi:hypothetical protein
MPTTSPAAHFDPAAEAVVIDDLTIGDRDVIREAQRWTTGERGPLVDDLAELAAADLTSFVTEALRIGSHALSVTGQAQEARALERMLKDVGDKTADATTKAAEVADRAMREASDTVMKAAGDAKKAITEAERQSRTEFTSAVTAAKTDLNAEVRRIFAGESPELLERLKPLLDKFGTSLDQRVRTSTEELLTKVARQFDPADPTSPMAKHSATLAAQQEQLNAQLVKNHAELTGKVEELTTALKVQEARTAMATVSPLKGGSFESQIHALMMTVAGGLGDEYSDTTTTVGQIPRSKKGDGVLAVDGGLARVVLETTDSHRTTWGGYLDEAERNRGAVASLGLVRTPTQNGGQSIRVLGSRRIVLAFDPSNDDPELLRTVVILLRTSSLTASSRTGTTEIATAEEKITEALAQLAKIDGVKKLAGSIQQNAQKIDSESSALATGSGA